MFRQGKKTHADLGANKWLALEGFEDDVDDFVRQDLRLVQGVALGDPAGEICQSVPQNASLQGLVGADQLEEEHEVNTNFAIIRR